VVNNEVYLAERVDFGRIATKFLHGSSHGSQINNCWNTGEILQEDTSGLEWNFDVIG
jgi:hypothetical protein